MEMKQWHPTVGIQRLCDEFGMHRQSFYEWMHRKDDKAITYKIVLEEVSRIRDKVPQLGTSKLYFLLKDFLLDNDIKMGRQALNSLLKKNNMLVYRTRKKPYTTNSNHPFRKYPNLIKGMIAERPDEIWVSDITYIAMPQGFSYLSLLTDAYSRKIIGWAFQDSLKASGPVEALKQAIYGRRYPRKSLIHHSDRGMQYCCHEYINLLNRYKIQISMTENGDPYENPLAERMNGILKEEFLLRGFHSYPLAYKRVHESIGIYNNFRPHGSLENRTPNQVYEKFKMNNLRKL